MVPLRVMLLRTFPLLLQLSICFSLLESTDATNNNTNTTGHRRFRLPKDLQPLNYQLNISADLETTFDYNGTVDIDVKCKRETSQIVLHSTAHNITSYSVKDLSTNNYINVVKMLREQESEMIELVMPSQLINGNKYRLSFIFRGLILQKPADGFFKYEVGEEHNKTRYVAQTEFRPASARSVFPCFDEPEFKAVFNIAIGHNKNLTASSNMPLKSLTRPDSNNMVTSIFQPTLNMSSYQVAFVISDFKYAEADTSSGVKIRIWTDSSKLHHLGHSLAAAKTSLTYCEKYFGYKYHSTKLDIYAKSNMEDWHSTYWGLATAREDWVIESSENITSETTEHLYGQMLEILALQWFSGLVTFKWWDQDVFYLGIAQYFSYFRAFRVNNPSSDMIEAFIQLREHAILSDSSIESRPIIPAVAEKRHMDIRNNSLYMIRLAYKASHLVDMIKTIVSEEKFKNGLQLYLKNNALKNADVEDFLNTFQKITQKDLNLTQIFHGWLYLQGFPLVELKRHKNYCAMAIVSQEKWISGSNQTRTAQEKRALWYVPVTYITSVSSTVRTRWLNQKSVGLPSKSKKIRWIKANINSTGFYRVNYDKENWKQLILQLQNNHTVFTGMDITGMTSDIFSLASSTKVDYKTVFGFMKSLSSIMDKNIANTLMTKLFFGILNNLKGTNLYQRVKKYTITIYKPILNNIGWEDKGSKSQRDLRKFVLWMLAALGDPDMVKLAKTKMHAWMKNDSNPVEEYLKTPVYMAAAMYGNSSEYEFIWNKYNSNSTEKKFMLEAVCLPPKKAQKLRLLKSLLIEKNLQYRLLFFNQFVFIGGEFAVKMAWTFFKNNLKTIVAQNKKDTSFPLPTILQKSIQWLKTDKQFKEFRRLIKKHKTILKDDVIQASASEEHIQSKILWLRRNEKDIRDYLDEQNIT